MDKCQQLGGGEFISKLASIHSEAENTFIYNTFVERRLISDAYATTAFIGFTQDYGKYSKINNVVYKINYAHQLIIFGYIIKIVAFFQEILYNLILFITKAEKFILEFIYSKISNRLYA